MDKQPRTPITRASLHQMLREAEEGRKVHLIGRALVALFERQTANEKQSNDAEVLNARGFASSDAKDGSIDAKYYLKHKTLHPRAIARWMEFQKGAPRLCKYWRQLEEVAAAKAGEAPKQ